MNPNLKHSLARIFVLSGLLLAIIVYIFEIIVAGESSLSLNQEIKLISAFLLYFGTLFYLQLKTNSLYKNSWNYLKENFNYVAVAILIFIAGSIVGIALKEQLSFLDDVLAQLIAQTSGLSTSEITIFIFLNNSLASIFALAGGVLLGIVPLLSSVSNGLILGYVGAKVAQTENILTLWRLLPHGIFELPAIFISFGLGIKLGFSIFDKKGRRLKEFKSHIIKSLSVLITIIVPLLVIAAIIEGILIGLFS